jgi:hypothetical protein
MDESVRLAAEEITPFPSPQHLVLAEIENSRSEDDLLRSPSSALKNIPLNFSSLKLRIIADICA